MRTPNFIKRLNLFNRQRDKPAVLALPAPCDHGCGVNMSEAQLITNRVFNLGLTSPKRFDFVTQARRVIMLDKQRWFAAFIFRGINIETGILFDVVNRAAVSCFDFLALCLPLTGLKIGA